MRKKLLHWAQTPIIVPRWFLTMKYAAFVILGFGSLFTGVQTIEFVGPAGYTSIWSAALSVSALIGVVSSLEHRFESVEKWAALVVAALMTAWGIFSAYRMIVEGDFSRLTGSWVILIAAGLPAVRTIGLMRTAGAE